MYSYSFLITNFYFKSLFDTRKSFIKSNAFSTSMCMGRAVSLISSSVFVKNFPCVLFSHISCYQYVKNKSKYITSIYFQECNKKEKNFSEIYLRWDDQKKNTNYLIYPYIRYKTYCRKFFTPFSIQYKHC